MSLSKLIRWVKGQSKQNCLGANWILQVCEAQEILKTPPVSLSSDFKDSLFRSDSSLRSREYFGIILQSCCLLVLMLPSKGLIPLWETGNTLKFFSQSFRRLVLMTPFLGFGTSVNQISDVLNSFSYLWPLLVCSEGDWEWMSAVKRPWKVDLPMNCTKSSGTQGSVNEAVSCLKVWAG